jgi:hypothetical protein
MVVCCYLCPTEKRELDGSAEELLDKHKYLRPAKEYGIRKQAKLFTKRVAGVKKFCIFAVRLNGAQKQVRLRVWKGIKVTKKTLKFLQKNIWSIRNK